MNPNRFALCFKPAVATLAVAAALAGATPGAWAREGVEVGKQSGFTRLVSAEQVEQAAAAQYTRP